MFSIKNIKFEGNKKKVATNVAWALAGKIVNMGGALLVGILVARYLGPEKYGLMNYVISYVSIFTVISTFGLENIEIRELSRNPERKEYILGTCLGVRLAFSCLALLLVGLSLVIHRADSFTTIMILLYTSTLFTGCLNVIRNYFTSIVKNEYIVKSEIARTCIGAFLKIILLWIKAPLEYFIIATAFDTVLVASGYVLSYHKIIGKISHWKFDRKLVPYLLRESFPLMLSGAAVIIYQRIDTVMIGNMIDEESVGYFATAGKFLELVLFLPTILTQTVTPLLIQTREQGTPTEYETKKRQFMGIVVWTSILLSTFVSVIGYPLVYFTFGTEYLPAVPVLQIMAWKTVGMALSSSGGQIIIMEGIQKWAFIRNIIGCCVCIGLNLIIIPEYGIVGSAWVTIATTMLSGTLINILIPPYWKILKLQLEALCFGWKELAYIKNMIKNK